MIRRLSSPSSLLEQLSQRRAEREFSRRVDRAFQADASAIARVRAQLLAQAPALAPIPALVIGPVRAPHQVRRWVSVAGASFAGLAVAVAFGIIVAGALRSPAQPSSPPVAIAAADLDRSAAYLQDVIATAQTGDAGALRVVLISFKTNLASIQADLALPGADLIGAATRLRSQALELSTISGSVAVADQPLFNAVTAGLNQMIAALPDPATSGHPGSTDHPGPTSHPGSNGHPSPPGQSKPTPAPTDPTKPTHKPLPSQANGGNGNGTANGNAGGNGKGNGKGK